MVENPWVKDSDSAYDAQPDAIVDYPRCEFCADEREDVRRRDGALLCDLCALVENKYGPCDEK